MLSHCRKFKSNARNDGVWMEWLVQQWNSPAQLQAYNEILWHLTWKCCDYSHVDASQTDSFQWNYTLSFVVPFSSFSMCLKLWLKRVRLYISLASSAIRCRESLFLVQGISILAPQRAHPHAISLHSSCLTAGNFHHYTMLVLLLVHILITSFVRVCRCAWEFASVRFVCTTMISIFMHCVSVITIFHSAKNHKWDLRHFRWELTAISCLRRTNEAISQWPIQGFSIVLREVSRYTMCRHCVYIAAQEPSSIPDEILYINIGFIGW